MEPTRRELIQGVGAPLSVLPAGVRTKQTKTPTETSPLTLWYGTAAKEWESEALPVGNGTLGAMVFDGVEHERIQLNEHSLWSGRYTEDGNPRAARASA